ncbi:MAG TPA: hypothetical protein VF486_06130 [Actinomycetes bacterium]
MTQPGNDDPAEGPPPAEDVPVDDIQVRESGLVAGGSVRITGDRVAGRDLTISVTGHNAAAGDLHVHQYFAPPDADAFLDEQLPVRRCCIWSARGVLKP